MPAGWGDKLTGILQCNSVKKKVKCVVGDVQKQLKIVHQEAERLSVKKICSYSEKKMWVS